MRDNKIHVGIRAEEINEIFNGNACGDKKSINGEEVREPKSIDQSTLQFYMILGIQDFTRTTIYP